MNPHPDEHALIEEIASLEKARHQLAARQAELVREFAHSHVESRTAYGTVEPEKLEPEKLERSIVAQIGLACRVSPAEGRRRLRIARDLHAGLDRVRALFAAGELSEYVVSVIVAATAHLDAAQRALVDAELAGRRVETLGARRGHDLARSIAARVAPEAFRRRCLQARSGRRVSVRPAADGMADLTAHLPVEQAVGCYASLVRAAQQAAACPEPLTRNRGQHMADTLVERLTGQTSAAAVPVEVQVVVPVEALLDDTSPAPAEIAGHGPVPVEIIRTGTAWRRLLTRDGLVIGGDSRRRTFTGVLAELIRARDGHRCREPWCDAPIRHLDHIDRHREGGATSFANGRGLCEFHNLVRESPGWQARVVGDDEHDNPGRGHTVVTTTPTEHHYRSTAGSAPPPARNDREVPLDLDHDLDLDLDLTVDAAKCRRQMVDIS